MIELTQKQAERIEFWKQNKQEAIAIRTSFEGFQTVEDKPLNKVPINDFLMALLVGNYKVIKEPVPMLINS